LPSGFWRDSQNPKLEITEQGTSHQSPLLLCSMSRLPTVPSCTLAFSHNPKHNPKAQEIVSSLHSTWKNPRKQLCLNLGLVIPGPTTDWPGLVWGWMPLARQSHRPIPELTSHGQWPHHIITQLLSPTPRTGPKERGGDDRTNELFSRQAMLISDFLTF
jgi:hypothetical protein